MSSFNKEKFEEAKEKANQFFKKNKKIKSLCLGTIHLNSDGFRHLIFKKEKHKRDWKQSIKRFELLNYLKPVIEKMGYYQEYFEETQQVKIKQNKSTILNLKKIKYWGFIAVINNKIRIKYILKQTGEGNIIFWSAVPAWKTKEYKEIKTIILHKGNLVED